jgi:hypothetical protein
MTWHDFHAVKFFLESEGKRSDTSLLSLELIVNSDLPEKYRERKHEQWGVPDLSW